MPNVLQEPPPPAGPDLATQLASEKAAREAIERENQRLVSEFVSRSAQQPPPAPVQNASGPHPLERVAKEGFGELTPMEQARTFDAAARRATRDVMTPIVQGVREEMRGEMERGLSTLALRALEMQNPDIAADGEGFAAAMVRARYRADQTGRRLDNAGLINEAVRLYREGKPAPPPHVESPSPGGPGAGVASPAKPPEKTPFELIYGVEPGMELHAEPYDHEAQTREYVDKRIEFLEEKGFNPLESSKVLSVRGEALERSARRAAAGGK